MTIIITAFDFFGNLHLVSDMVELTNGEVSVTNKTYITASNDCTWAVAGYPPSRAMKSAKTLAELWEATTQWTKASPTNQILIVEHRSDGRPLAVWVSYYETGCEPSLTEVASHETAIGGYATIWPSFKRNYRADFPDLSNWEVAIKFCSLVNKLSGLYESCAHEAMGSVNGGAHHE